MGKKIKSIEVINAEKRRIPSKHYVYVILVTWSHGSTVTIYRRYSRFFDLQTRLLDHFPIEGGIVDPEKRVIPFLPGKIFIGRSQIKDVAMKRLKEINEYCKNLIALPPHISECDDVLEYFEVEPDDLDPPTSSVDEGKRKLSLTLSLNNLSKLKGSKEKKAEKITAPKRLECYVAVAEYVVQASGEVALKPGLKVEVLEKSDSGWWFVNSEDEQGWVPSTYLEREGGANPHEKQGPMAVAGQEENYICIEKFQADSSDEISLEKGAVVQVLQKNMDGWWLVRYKGREAYAPGTYLKKTSNVHTVSMIEQSRLSGVEIISSLHDVSNLMNQEVKVGKEQTKQNTVTPQAVSNKTNSRTSALVKQKSLERGGSLNPPPRQNSVVKMEIPASTIKTSVYVTADDFNCTVGDGLSFEKGEQAVVLEKTATGWWFVKIGEREGWVPSTYLESYNEHTEVKEESDHDYIEEDDEEWYVEVQDVPDSVETVTISDQPAKRSLPALPPDEDNRKSSSATRPLPLIPAEKIPPVTPKIPTSYQKPAVMKPPEVEKKSPSEHSHTQTNTVPKAGGPPDFAALLKAKFEARSGAPGDSGSSSEEDAFKVSKLSVSKPQGIPKSSVPNTKTIGLIPVKPSGHRESQELGHLPSSGFGGVKSVSKPPPPAKLKPVTPLKPSVVPSDTQASKTNKLSLPPKPLSKSPTDDVDKTAESSEKVDFRSAKAAFGNSQTPKIEPGKKPQVISKPKPAVLPKSSKPTSSDIKSSQSVNSLANSLSSKLSFGQNPNQTKSFSSDDIKSKASLPAVSLKSSSTSSSAAKSYIAISNFVAENDGELGLNEGDEVEVLDQQGEWSLIRCWDEQGWAPSGYLQKL